MDDHEDIFGQDVRDTSHLQIVSSDEEDLTSKTPENTRTKNSLGFFSTSNKSETMEERFDRHYRLDQSLKSDISDDAQNIIDELNKIFDKSEQIEKTQNELPKEVNQENLLSKGINLINNIKSSLLSESKEPTKEIEETNTSKTKRKRACTKNNSNIYTNFKDLFSSSSSESSLGDDEEYNPVQPSGRNPKKSRKNNSKFGNNSKNKENSTTSDTILQPNKHDRSRDKRFDNFGFDNFSMPEEPEPFNFESSQQTQDNSSDLFCLKFAVVDQNKRLINDPKLEAVYVKTTETLGSIAKKVGQMYGLDEEQFVKIKIIIDGDSHDHKIQIGDPQLCIENNMQIDIKFPPKENVQVPSTFQKDKPSSRTKKNEPKPPKIIPMQIFHTSKPIEIVEID
uniref:Uncharacterized protein n=1 Tax=Theileria annulata TaxID=5874 RepID=A0A3B0N3S5_THEAN